jgi:hypothetical protein
VPEGAQNSALGLEGGVTVLSATPAWLAMSAIFVAAKPWRSNSLWAASRMSRRVAAAWSRRRGES